MGEIANEIELLGASAPLEVDWVWRQLIGGPAQWALEAAIGRSIVTRRWFGSKSRVISAVEIINAIGLAADVRLILIQVEFREGPAETYQIPLAFAAGDKAAAMLAEPHASIWTRVRSSELGEPAVIYDGLGNVTVCGDLLGLIADESRWPATMGGELAGWRAPAFQRLRGDSRAELAPRIVQAEQSNSSVIFGDRLILKLFRRVEQGLHPDLELSEYLSEHGFAQVPPLAGALELRSDGEQPLALAMLQGFVPNQGDAWQFLLQALAALLDRTAKQSADTATPPELPGDDLCDAANRPFPQDAEQWFSAFLAGMGLLGTRTAEMHRTLAAATDPAMAPEPFSAADERDMVEHTRALAEATWGLLAGQLARLPGDVARTAERVLRLKPEVDHAIRAAGSQSIHALAIRCHGDYHLGQVLVTDHDFMIIDFEGEPARPLAERRRKQLALRDVAGMLRSFHYASCSASTHVKQSVPGNDPRAVDTWASAWCFWTSAAFLGAYRRAAAGAVFLPADEAEFRTILRLCILEKAIYELQYELNNRPDWVYLPLEALLDILLPKRAAQRPSDQ